MIAAMTRYRPPAGSSGVAVVSVSDGGSQTSSAVVTAPAGVVLGHLLYALVACDDTAANPTITCTGWTQHIKLVINTANDNGFLIGFYKWATASEPTSYTWSGATNKACTIGLIALSGVNATTPFNATPTIRTAASSATCVFPAITTTTSCAIILGAAQVGSFSAVTSNAIVWGSGYTSAVNSLSQYNKQATYDAEVVYGGFAAAIGAGTFTAPSATFNKAFKYGAMVVALNPA